jgi:alginate O-acetyltransferase complex protein AlgI
VVFSSITFLVYFLPVLLLLYHFTPTKFKNGLLLLASILFYSWGAPRFIFVILGTTFLDFYLVRLMDQSSNENRRKFLMVLSISMNLGLLFYFKYCNFFIDNANHFFKAIGIQPIHFLKVALPIGISFYTFESLTYVIDVYRKVHKPLHNFWQYQLYIILFPKLIAGPIIRYHEIADQIEDRNAFDNADNKLLGFFRFSIGLAKKVFIANTLGAYADDAFHEKPELLNSTMAWVGMLSYTFQIYFDFSGYSDMAIGLGRMFGFRFPENFDNPYTSQSITEFWRRWHITLGKWMKNYLYIPLGGNRTKTPQRLYFNLWLVFLASGLWHGASWTFVIWGIYHGFFMVMERLFLENVYKKLGKFLSTTITFFIVAFGWIIFRSESLYQAKYFILKIFSSDFGWMKFPIDYHYAFYFLLAVIFSFFTSFKKGEAIQQRVYYSDRSFTGHLGYAVAACCLLTLAIAALASAEFNPFIYFRF